MSGPGPCACPDPWCPVHARCVCGGDLLILPGDPAFCLDCNHDVMPAGACGTFDAEVSR